MKQDLRSFYEKVGLLKPHDHSASFTIPPKADKIPFDCSKAQSISLTKPPSQPQPHPKQPNPPTSKKPNKKGIKKLFYETGQISVIETLLTKLNRTNDIIANSNNIMYVKDLSKKMKKEIDAASKGIKSLASSIIYKETEVNSQIKYISTCLKGLSSMFNNSEMYILIKTEIDKILINSNKIETTTKNESFISSNWPFHSDQAKPCKEDRPDRKAKERRDASAGRANAKKAANAHDKSITKAKVVPKKIAKQGYRKRKLSMGVEDLE
jgi:hypothetical protein